MDEGLSLLRQAVRRFPDHYAAYANLSTLYRLIGKNREARAVLEAAAVLDPEPFDRHLALAGQFHAEGQYHEARTEYEAALRQRPEDTVAAGRFAILHYEHRQYAHALPLIQGILTRRPHWYHALYLLAVVKRETGHTEEAIVALEATVQINPGFRAAYRDLVMLLFRTGRWRAILGHIARFGQHVYNETHPE